MAKITRMGLVLRQHAEDPDPDDRDEEKEGDEVEGEAGDEGDRLDDDET